VPSLKSRFTYVFDICRRPCSLAIWAQPVSTCHFDRLCNINVPRPTARAILIFANQSPLQSPSFAPPAASFAHTCCPSIYRSAAHCRPHTASHTCAQSCSHVPLSLFLPPHHRFRGGVFNRAVVPPFPPFHSTPPTSTPTRPSSQLLLMQP